MLPEPLTIAEAAEALKRIPHKEADEKEIEAIVEFVTRDDYTPGFGENDDPWEYGP